MPGQFVLLKTLEFAGSDERCLWRCSGAAVVFGSVLDAVCEEVALFAKAAKFVVLQERVGFLRFLVVS